MGVSFGQILLKLVNVKNIPPIRKKGFSMTKQKTVYLGDSTNLNTKILSMKAIIEKTEGTPGEIFMNKDLNDEYPVFRERI